MSEVRRPSGSAATRPRRFYVGTNLYGTGCNIGVELARDAAATADDWRWAIGRILGAEEAERRPHGFPAAPVTVAALAVYDDASGVWGPLPGDLASLEDGAQLWAFQAPNALHSELSTPLPSPADGVSSASFVALRRVFFRAASAAKTASKRVLESRFVRAGLPSPASLVGPQLWPLDAGASPHVAYAEWEALCLGTPALLEAVSELAAGGGREASEEAEVRSPPATPAPKWPPTAHQQRQHATAALLRSSSASASASVATAAGPSSSRASSTAEAGGGSCGAAAHQQQQQEEVEPEVVYSQLLLGDGVGAAGRRRSGGVPVTATAESEPEWPYRARRQSTATTEPADSPKEEAAAAARGGRSEGGVEEEGRSEERDDLALALSHVRSRRLSLQSGEGGVDELSATAAAAGAAAAATAAASGGGGVGRAGSAAVLSMASSPGVSPHDASGLALRSVSRASFVSDAVCAVPHENPPPPPPPTLRHEVSQPPSRAATPAAASGAAGEADAGSHDDGRQGREGSKVRWGDEFDLLEQQIAAARLRRHSLEMDCAWTEPRKTEQP